MIGWARYYIRTSIWVYILPCLFSTVLLLFKIIGFRNRRAGTPRISFSKKKKKNKKKKKKKKKSINSEDFFHLIFGKNFDWKIFAEHLIGELWWLFLSFVGLYILPSMLGTFFSVFYSIPCLTFLIIFLYNQFQKYFLTVINAFCLLQIKRIKYNQCN